MKRNIYKIGKELFITSNEEIKEGDYILIHGHYQYGKHITKVIKITDTYEVIEGGNHSKKICQKIILTTDQDLIKDGIQAIDYDSLKCLVENPSCEEVEVFKDFFQVNQNNPILKGSTALVESYKIIIPKEEPKETLKDYLQVCKDCGSEEVARCKWVNVNTEEIYSADSGTNFEWCFDCKNETNIIDKEDYEK